MSEFTLQRTTENPTWTYGKILGPNGEFICRTMEDKLRDESEDKVKGETAINAGRYRLTFIDGDKRHSNLFNKMRKNRTNRWNMRILPVIEESDGSERCGRHTFVRIHTGKDTKSSFGCPITAMELTEDGNTRGTSDAGFKALHDALLSYYEDGVECWITVKNPS